MTARCPSGSELNDIEIGAVSGTSVRLPQSSLTVTTPSVLHGVQPVVSLQFRIRFENVATPAVRLVLLGPKYSRYVAHGMSGLTSPSVNTSFTTRSWAYAYSSSFVNTPGPT